MLKKGNAGVRGGYNTPKQARDDGAVVMVYGYGLYNHFEFLELDLHIEEMLCVAAGVGRG